MYIVTSEQSKKIDAYAIEKLGIPSIKLMENAGKGVAEEVKKILETIKGKRIAVFCGKGNNGGDGWVSARYLHMWGYDVEVFQMGDIDELSGDALENARKAISIGVVFGEYSEPPTIKDFDLIIDALVGTGFKGRAEGRLKAFIDAINGANIDVVSIDIPSGLDANTGRVEGSVVRATVTVTLGFPKLGLCLYPGRELVGSLRVVDIGIPKDVALKENIIFETNDPAELFEFLPYRAPDGHKGTFGKGIIIAGSIGYTGAPALVCESFLRSGAGYCVLGVPRSLADIMSVKLTETVIKPLPEVRKKRVISLRAVGEITQLFESADALVIGPGLGRYFETVELVRRILKRTRIPTLVDADGIYALSQDLSTLEEIIAPVVFTPHHGELANLLGLTVEDVVQGRLVYAKEWARKLGGVLVIKGNPTLITSSECERVYLNLTGNDGMATAGSGDVLSGLIGGFLAQGVEPIRAARLGCYIHGLAGDIAASYLGKRSLVATDILANISGAIIKLETLGFDPSVLF